MKVLAMIIAVGAAVGAASCRDNRMSESFDRDEASNEVAPATGGSGSAGEFPVDLYLYDNGAHGSTGADDELLRGE